MRRVGIVVVVAVAVVAGAVVGIVHVLNATSATAPSCLVGNTKTGVVLEPRQAANAATIAAVGRREQLPNHAVTIALAAALQESKLHNLDYGDRDSLGLFQQRPSQGWGTPAQLLQPAYAAGEFFSHLDRVPGWRSLPVAEAAQRVQHSADGSAYARWEDEARALARALTGEVVAGLTCHFTDPTVPHRDALATAVRTDLGRNGLHSTGDLAHDWSVASWLVAHAYAYGVRTISVQGRTWTSASGAWRQNPSAGAGLTYRYGSELVAGYHSAAHRKGDGVRVFSDRNIIEDNLVFSNAADGIGVGFRTPKAIIAPEHLGAVEFSAERMQPTGGWSTVCPATMRSWPALSGCATLRPTRISQASASNSPARPRVRDEGIFLIHSKGLPDQGSWRSSTPSRSCASVLASRNFSTGVTRYSASTSCVGISDSRWRAMAMADSLSSTSR